MAFQNRGSYGSYGDEWATMFGTMVAWVAAAIIFLTLWLLFQVCKHLGRAFAREPKNPALWIPLLLSMGFGLLALALGAAHVNDVLTFAAAAIAAYSLLVLILVGVTISITSEKMLPTEPESLVNTVFKKSWW